jgi:hypothetical protein
VVVELRNQEDKMSEERRLLTHLGDGLGLYMVPLEFLREQDVNARIMDGGEYGQMVSNIRKSGYLESVPLCATAPDDTSKLEIVSGHHRIRAAREAGLKEVPILLDSSGLSRTEIVAKQLAHNRLVGRDDPELLRQLFELLDTPELMLESGLANDLLDIPEVDLDQLLAPRLEMDWKVITFTFLPHQFDDMQGLLDAIPATDLLLAGSLDQFSEFMKATIQYARIKNVRNAGLAIASLTAIALKEIEESQPGGSDAGV